MQLAFCLSELAKQRKFPYAISYHGNEVLKGVIDGKPYPIISVDTERNRVERELRRRELDLLGTVDQSEFALSDYLLCFMKGRNIDIPVLWFGDIETPHTDGPPPSYASFVAKYAAVRSDDRQTRKEFDEATDPVDPQNDNLLHSTEFFRRVREVAEVNNRLREAFKGLHIDLANRAAPNDQDN